MTTRQLIVAVFGSSIGNLLEWFDFAMFGLLADEIGGNFFPDNTPGIQVLESFAVFAAAFFMRPIGGTLFGYIGDKYGRITSLRLSLFMMAIPTFLTGCLPKYSTIGIAAPILLSIFRLIQGLSVGGEFTGAITYVVEICPPNQKALYNMLVHISGTGTLLGTIVVGIMRVSFTPQQMHDWAWRIPFLFGVVVAIFGIWMRKGMQTSGEFEKKKADGQLLENPIREVLYNHKTKLLIIVCHLLFQAAFYYSIWIWLPEYAYNKEVNPIKSMYLINGVNMVINMLFMLLSGWIIDRYLDSDPSKSLIFWGVLLSLYTILVFPFLPNVDVGGIVVIQMGWAVLNGMYHGGWSLWGIERFKDETAIRYTGFGIGYNIALALFGGTAPLIATWLVLSGHTW
eukprot:101864_1